MKKLIVLVFCIVYSFIIPAQTFISSTGGSIPDNGQPTYFPILVSGLTSSVLDSSFGVQSVCINILHNSDYQLTIELMAPDGTLINLSLYNGGTGNNYSNTCFTGTAANSITAGNPPYTGNYRPEGVLGNVNNGQNGNGTWRIKVQDHNAGVVGSLVSWRITFSNTPAYPFIYTSSNLPIVVVNTFGLPILDNPKVVAHMGIIDNGIGIRNFLTDPFNSFDGSIGIERRGSWSQTFPQVQYGFETWDSLNNAIDTLIMGMPTENDWILYAPYNDKTCMRNVLIYDIANKTGHYASRTRFCELILNNNYKGIYVMLEKVKRDVNRVDISKLTTTDTSGTDLTGGYIVKIDKVTGSGGGVGWDSQYDGYPGTPIHFQYEYPSFDVIMPQQKAYIKSYVDSFEDALYAPWFTDPLLGYKKYIDVQSFIDYFILNETCKNVDAYRNSTFLYKEKITKGGKLVAGPAWDYNICFNNADYCEGYLYTGWQYNFNNICGTPGDNNVPFWWNKMLQDTVFANALQCRWQLLRQTTLNTITLWNEIDSIAAVLDEAKDRHFIQWPILGVQTWANPSPIPPDYAGEISSMKLWIFNRLNWLDANMPGSCGTSGISSNHAFVENVQVYPNPFSDVLKVGFNIHEKGKYTIDLIDIFGRVILQQSVYFSNLVKQEVILNCSDDLSTGLFLVKVRTGNNNAVVKVIKQ